jgi:photosystem II stability/assembly factor-like uncharacterized protein
VVRRVDRVAILALAHAGRRLVAAGERGRILTSDDQGASWKVASTPTHHTLTSLAFTDARTGFATGHQRVLLRTEDGGDTWKHAALQSQERPALFAVRIDGDRGIAVGAYGAYFESADAGRTWTARRIGAPDFDRHLTGIAAAGGGRYVLAGEAGTLLATAGRGATWRPSNLPTRARSSARSDSATASCSSMACAATHFAAPMRPDVAAHRPRRVQGRAAGRGATRRTGRHPRRRGRHDRDQPRRRRDLPRGAAREPRARRRRRARPTAGDACSPGRAGCQWKPGP